MTRGNRRRAPQIKRNLSRESPRSHQNECRWVVLWDVCDATTVGQCSWWHNWFCFKCHWFKQICQNISGWCDATNDVVGHHRTSTSRKCMTHAAGRSSFWISFHSNDYKLYSQVEHAQTRPFWFKFAHHGNCHIVMFFVFRRRGLRTQPLRRQRVTHSTQLCEPQVDG